MIDHIYRHIPAYHKFMYLDGYTPNEIMYAFRKKTRAQIEEQTIINTIELEKVLDLNMEKALNELFKDWK